MSSNVSDSQPYVLTYSMSTYEAGGFNSPSSWNAGGQALHGILHNPPNQEQTMEKKAIIFGVTGQDGSHLADLLLEKNYQVIGVGRRVVRHAEHAELLGAATDADQRLQDGGDGHRGVGVLPSRMAKRRPNRRRRPIFRLRRRCSLQ